MPCRPSPPRGPRGTGATREPGQPQRRPSRQSSEAGASLRPGRCRQGGRRLPDKSSSLFFGGTSTVAQCSPATNRAPIHSVVRPPVAFPPGQRESGGKRPHKCHGESGCRGTGAPRRVERVIDVDLEPKQWSAPALPSNGVAKQRTAPTPWGRWATRRRGLRTSRPGLRPRRP